MKTKIYTITKAAKLCGVSPRTFCHWFDMGMVGGYRLPAGDRRIPAAELRKFMQWQGMPLGELEEDKETP